MRGMTATAMAAASLITIYHRKGRKSITEKKETPQDRYDKKNTVHIGLKLNRKTDADILKAIDDKPKQTEIKRLLRVAIENEQKK